MMRRMIVVAASVLCASASAAQRPLKVYISADMEGITGVVSPDQLGPTGFEYQKAREWMTAEVLAAIQGARDAGATEFVVSDSHGNGESLLLEKFPTDVPVTLVRSFPRPLGMMEGIDSSFAAVIFIGYHAATTSTTGVRALTCATCTCGSGSRTSCRASSSTYPKAASRRSSGGTASARRPRCAP